MDYRIKGGTGKRPVVLFRCHQCHANLRAPLSDAGHGTPCPSCKTQLTVPGIREFEAWSRNQQGQAQQAARLEQQRQQAQADRAANANDAEATSKGEIPSPPRPSRAPARTGASVTASDRILRFAYGFFRGAVVIAIPIAVALVVVCVVWIVKLATYSPPPPGPDEVVQLPELEMHVGLAQRFFAERAVSQASDTATPPTVPTAWSCGEHSQQIEDIVARLGFDPNVRNTICTMVDETHREALFLKGLDEFAAALLSDPVFWSYVEELAYPTGTEQGMIEWYYNLFKSMVGSAAGARKDRQEQIKNQQDANARDLRTAVELIIVVIGILAALIVLPLLIQIERNTRAGAVARTKSTGDQGLA